jgi:hypothetical protein
LAKPLGLRWGAVAGLALAAGVGLSGCGGSADEYSTTACSEVDSEQVCATYSDSSSALFEVLELWVELDAWTPNNSGRIGDAWSPLAKLTLAPASANLSFVARQSEPVWLRFGLGVWPAQAAAAMRFKLEDPAGWVLDRWIENAGTAHAALHLRVRTDVPAGTHRPALRLHLCHGADCSQTYHGSPVTLPLTLQVN